MVVAEQRERETEIVRRAEAGFELLAKAAVCPAFPDPSDVLQGDALRAGLLGVRPERETEQVLGLDAVGMTALAMRMPMAVIVTLVVRLAAMAMPFRAVPAAMVSGAMIVTVPRAAMRVAAAVRSMLVAMSALPVRMPTTVSVIVTLGSSPVFVLVPMPCMVVVPGVGMSPELLWRAEWARFDTLLTEGLLGGERSRRKQPHERDRKEQTPHRSPLKCYNVA